VKLKTVLGNHPAIVGGLLVVGLVGVSVAGVALAEGRGSDGLESRPVATTSDRAAATTTTSSTTTTSTTTTTTSTEPPAPEPAPNQGPGPSGAANTGGSTGGSNATGGAPPAPAPEPPPPPPPPPPEPGPPGLAGQILAAMNADRGANGVGPLGWHGGLGGYAQDWANWMAQNQSLTHQYLSPMFSLGLNTLGENILVGPSGMSAGAMETAWMNSPGHRVNILNGSFTVAGVGVAVSADGRIWVAVDFGG